ncbi:MAG: hypothetical protein JSR47_22655 [Proteobacteria bacterium]|nr:hypothetical protein [Pseudomonadota bacterium]MBS0547824.1 hypothetical protein [Pseudomonadota bacterium]
MSLSETDRRTLAAVAAILIPADSALGMPSAGDPAILADIERSIGRDGAAVAEILTGLGGANEATILDRMAEPDTAARLFGRLVLGAYYRDDRVLAALGHEARAPFPKGYVLDQGDWSLLDPVKQRPIFWRKDA